MVQGPMNTIRMKGFVWLLVSIFFQFCVLAPASAFTIGDEREVGEKLLYSVRSSFKLIDDPDISQYINRLGQSVLEVAGIQYFNYHFFVIDNKEFQCLRGTIGIDLFSLRFNRDDEFRR